MLLSELSMDSSNVLQPTAAYTLSWSNSRTLQSQNIFSLHTCAFLCLLCSCPVSTNMAKRTLPLLFINLGGEMMYILDQRLTAQAIEPDKASKVMRMKGKVVKFC